jgi:AAA ATPase domain
LPHARQREDECARIDRLLEQARAGRSGALVVRGEAGIGKSALLDYAAAHADDMAVARALGVESEAELEFSGLLEVCGPLLDRLPELPERQAAALRGALGLGPAEPVERFAVAAATMTLLAAAAEEAPLLVLVDDAHWLDRSSTEALVFALRRLQADPVAVVFAVRDDEGSSFAAPGVEVVEIGGLDHDAVAKLLAAASDVSLTPELPRRLHAATRGNPLALLELLSLLTPDQLSGAAPLEEPLPSGAAVERAFLRRAAALPVEAHRALVVAAVEGSTEIEPVLSALGRLGLHAHSLEPAEDAGLLRIDRARLVFRHPLVRSAVFHAARPSERRSAHRALAEVLVGRGRDEERAWHLAAAVLGPDEEAAGRSPRSRGGRRSAVETPRRPRPGQELLIRLARLAGLGVDDLEAAPGVLAGTDRAVRARNRRVPNTGRDGEQPRDGDQDVQLLHGVPPSAVWLHDAVDRAPRKEAIASPDSRVFRAVEQ